MNLETFQSGISKAVDSRDFKAVRDLIDQMSESTGEYSSPLAWACQIGYLDAVKRFIEKNPSSIYDKKAWPFRCAAANGHLDIVKYLFQQGIDIHVDDDYAFCWAAKRGHLDIVKYLFQQGANIHARDDYALRWAAWYGHLEIVKYLVNQGASMRADSLRHAVANGHFDVVKFLISHGADPSAWSEGTALTYAVRKKHYDIAAYLYLNGADLEALYRDNDIGNPDKAKERILKKAAEMKLSQAKRHRRKL